jgi:hypothetical protein
MLLSTWESSGLLETCFALLSDEQRSALLCEASLTQASTPGPTALKKYHFANGENYQFALESAKVQMRALFRQAGILKLHDLGLQERQSISATGKAEAVSQYLNNMSVEEVDEQIQKRDEKRRKEARKYQPHEYSKLSKPMKPKSQKTQSAT